ncbi:MAG: hypothetical protein R3E10_17330 [Gemmatimonadota bacterium]
MTVPVVSNGWRRRATEVIGCLVGIVLLGWGTSGCGEEVAGPGHVRVSFESQGVEVGAALVELTGEGILGVEGAGASRAVGFELPGGGWRVVVTSRTGEPPSFRIPVVDRRAPLPVGVLIQAVDVQNRPLAGTGGIRMLVQREE